METCSLHGTYHCLDCGYVWWNVTDDDQAEHVEGTGAGA